MPRQETLLRLQETLVARRKELRKLLAGELAYLHEFKAADAAGDSADLAFEAGCDEMSSRLAELDARELLQVERVLARLKEGAYGLCEGAMAQCQRKIPIARLKALPYATFCINCERAVEKTFRGQDRQYAGNWGHVHDSLAAGENPRINVVHMEMNLSGKPGVDFGTR